ncbi:2Fe-2S iron-sulfur cluster-binding protein, partial [Streptomyces asiaticus]
ATDVVLDDEEIAERMSGNLCRCAAYANIVPAPRPGASRGRRRRARSRCRTFRG